MISDEAQLALARDRATSICADGVRPRRTVAVAPVSAIGRRRSVTGSSPATLPVAANITRSSVASVAWDLGGDAALVEDEDPVGHREDLGQVARDEDDRRGRTRRARR